MEVGIQFEGGELRGQLERLPQALRGAVERGLARATKLLERAAAAHAGEPFGAKSSGSFGELAASVASEVLDEGGQKVGRVFLAPPADRYGLFVEVGTRPHFPPPVALEGWVRNRLGVTNDREVRKIAFLVGRKIARQGTPGRFFMERALRENEDRVVAILEEEIAGAVAR